jgi:hypothetical protein
VHACAGTCGLTQPVLGLNKGWVRQMSANEVRTCAHGDHVLTSVVSECVMVSEKKGREEMKREARGGCVLCAQTWALFYRW